jgi:hypothetical protein
MAVDERFACRQVSAKQIVNVGELYWYLRLLPRVSSASFSLFKPYVHAIC